MRFPLVVVLVTGCAAAVTGAEGRCLACGGRRPLSPHRYCRRLCRRCPKVFRSCRCRHSCLMSRRQLATLSKHHAGLPRRLPAQRHRMRRLIRKRIRTRGWSRRLPANRCQSHPSSGALAPGRSKRPAPPRAVPQWPGQSTIVYAFHDSSACRMSIIAFLCRSQHRPRAGRLTRTLRSRGLPRCFHGIGAEENSISQRGNVSRQFTLASGRRAPCAGTDRTTRGDLRANDQQLQGHYSGDCLPVHP